jgi:uncharacterized protein
MRKRFFRFVKIFILVYCTIGIALYFFQYKLFFHPEPLPREYKYQFDDPHAELNIPYSESSNMNVVRFLPDTPRPKGVVLYFHGNRTNISRYAPFTKIFCENGYEVIMPDYPGYGKSTGSFEEKTLYEWGMLTYKLARARFEPNEIVIYGRSLGSGIACQLASIRDCKNLILESPYYNFPSIPASYLPIYPYRRILDFEFPNNVFLKDVIAPVTIFHGTSDWTIPLRNSKRLKQSLKTSDTFIVVNGAAHNDISEFEEYKKVIRRVLREVKSEK